MIDFNAFTTANRAAAPAPDLLDLKVERNRNPVIRLFHPDSTQLAEGDHSLNPELKGMNWYKLALMSLAEDAPVKVIASKTIVFGPKKKPRLPVLAPTGPQPPNPLPPSTVPSTKAPAAGKGHKRWRPPSRSA